MKPGDRDRSNFTEMPRLLCGGFGDVADEEAVLLLALLHPLGERHAHGEGGDDEDGQDGERLLHDLQTRFLSVSFSCTASSDSMFEQSLMQRESFVETHITVR